MLGCMKFFAALSTLFAGRKKAVRKTIADYQQEVLVRQGRVQFEKLMQKGLSIPVVLL